MEAQSCHGRIKKKRETFSKYWFCISEYWHTTTSHHFEIESHSFEKASHYFWHINIWTEAMCHDFEMQSQYFEKVSHHFQAQSHYSESQSQYFDSPVNISSHYKSWEIVSRFWDPLSSFLRLSVVEMGFHTFTLRGKRMWNVSLWCIYLHPCKRQATFYFLLLPTSVKKRCFLNLLQCI